MTTTLLDGGVAPSARGEAQAIRATARLAGCYYLAMSVLSGFAYIYAPRHFIVGGDAAATAGRIMAGAPLYRLSIAAALLGQILFLLTALALYRLFRDVQRGQARLLVTLVAVAVCADIVNAATRYTPLLLLGGGHYLDPFTRPQLEALSLAALRWGNALGNLVTAFWGLWLFPFGALTIRSGFFPRSLGYLLFVSGFAYVLNAFTFLLFPDQLQLISRVLTPLYLGELGMVLWLPLVGARPAAPQPPAT